MCLITRTWVIPTSTLSSSSFGLVNGTIGGDSGGARTGQVSACVEF
jgi:hypothetical protein